MTNRIILCINAVLVAAVLLLSFATLSISRTLQGLPDRIAGQAHAGAASNTASGPDLQRDPRESGTALTPELAVELRQLIRDELRANASLALDAAGNPKDSMDGRTGVESLAGTPSNETAWQAVLVEQEIDFYVNRGAISPAEMSALQSEIAKLDPEGRADAMRRLIGAINAGELDGRL